MSIDERVIEALAIAKWNEMANGHVYPQAWEETREDNRQWCRAFVQREYAPIIEVYEAAKAKHADEALDLNDYDPEGDAYAKGYADGYKAKALEWQTHWLYVSGVSYSIEPGAPCMSTAAKDDPFMGSGC